MSFFDRIRNSLKRSDSLSPDDQLRAVLAKHGDDGTKPRVVDHYVYFQSEEDSLQYEEFVVARGYKIDESQHQFAVAFSKESPIVAPDFDRELAVLRSQAETCQGEYDGWACPVVK